LFLIILILYLSDKELKNWDLILGLLVSLLFLTKQTIGLCMFIPMIYYSKNKLKSLICFLIPVFLFVIYLLWNNALCNFIDYCFLGMFDFTGSNSIYLFFPFEIVICFVLIFKLIKCRFNDKKLFYVIMFQIISIPICDDYHFMIAFLAVLYYLLDNLKIKLYKVKYLIIIFIVIMFGKIYLFNYGIEYSLYSDKDSYLYGRYIERYIEEDLNNISYYLNDIKDSYDYVFLLTVNSYMIKLNTDYDINKFDLINNGNMGYNGYAKYINEIDNICSSNSCVFVLCKIEVDDDSNFQTNKEILNYVIDNYYFVEELYGFDVYSNSEVYYE
jgi:hypothetical protein